MKLLLDVCCCEGAAGSGYHRAGFEVVGVDIEPRFAKRYPYEFHAADGLDFITKYGGDFDAIHVSPPCQGYTRGNAGRETKWPKLIPDFREVLVAIGKPYIIENVKDAGKVMIDPVSLCGCMFDLKAVDTDGITVYLERPRLFETDWGMTAPQPCTKCGSRPWVAGAYGGARRDKYEAKYVRKGGYVPKDKAVVQALLGIEHDMTWNGLFESVPPAYTEHVGRQLLERL